MTEAYIGIGSNLGDPLQLAKQAVVALSKMSQSRLIACSTFVGSKPLDRSAQPDYVNAVVALETALSPEQLLEHMQAIEQRFGRERKVRWGARTLDLDLLLYGKVSQQTPYLTLPHYGMRERAFVLYPLYEIAPQLELPDGTPLASLLTGVVREGLTELHPPFLPDIPHLFLDLFLSQYPVSA
ncbi:MAG: 2-amino-4-hydroxy-6-hydroxymethyldihydropteridine diphosphokinase [Vibrionaceae bacterium]